MFLPCVFGRHFSMLSALLICTTLTGTLANAGTVLSDRTTLLESLGTAAKTENFQAFNLASEPELEVFGMTLDASTKIPAQFQSIPAQGPGLIVQDLRFTADVFLVVRGPGFGSSSQFLSLNRGPLVIDFSAPVTAFGLDLFPEILTGTNVSLTVFAADDTGVLERDTVLVFSSGSFVGVFEPTSIGSVALSAQAVSFDDLKGVNIDNVTFGRPSAVSQPETFLLLGVGLLGLVLFWRARANRNGCG